MATVSVAHITDLHFSESLVMPNAAMRLPHRYGHDLNALYQLDAQLKATEWDALVVSGDVSRVGHRDSFVLAQNWIENDIVIGGLSIGLGLKKKKIPYVIVHDRFNDRLAQDVLDAYHTIFPVVQPNTTVTHTVNGIPVNFHLYDSSCRGGGFAVGRIEEIAMAPKVCNAGALDIAVLHHHLFPPPGHGEDALADIDNSDDALAYFLACGFDAICVGHTHISYSNVFARQTLAAVISDRRRVGRLAKKIDQIKSWFGGERWHKVPKCRDGKQPSINDYVQYLFIRDKLGIALQPVSKYTTVKQFTDAIRHYDGQCRSAAASARKHRTLLSMAPSAMQAEAREKGFHVLRFTFDAKNLLTDVVVEHHKYLSTGYEVAQYSYQLKTA